MLQLRWPITEIRTEGRLPEHSLVDQNSRFYFLEERPPDASYLNDQLCCAQACQSGCVTGDGDHPAELSLSLLSGGLLLWSTFLGFVLLSSRVMVLIASMFWSASADTTNTTERSNMTDRFQPDQSHLSPSVAAEFSAFARRQMGASSRGPGVDGTPGKIEGYSWLGGERAPVVLSGDEWAPVNAAMARGSTQFWNGVLHGASRAGRTDAYGRQSATGSQLYVRKG